VSKNSNSINDYMNKLTRAAIFAVGAALVAQSAQASFTANDLYLGFTDASATSDYIIDLGQPGAVGVGGSSVVDLSGSFSSGLFSSFLGVNSLTGVSAGVVGGESKGFPLPSVYDIYATSLRVGGAGNAGVAGSNLSGFIHSGNSISTSVAPLTGNPWAASGTGGALDSNKSWASFVAPTLTTGSFYGASGINPNSAFDNTGVLYEDLWGATSSSAYGYLGFFKLDLSGGALNSFTFTPNPNVVPEPTVLGLLGGAGILLLSLRRRLSGRNV